MDERRGEQLGWTLGFLGGALWMIPTSVILVWSGRILPGAIGLSFFALAVACTVYLAPWRHPRVAYWKLFTPFFVVELAAVYFLLFVGAAPQERSELTRLGPMMLVFVVAMMARMGRWRWDDRNAYGGAITPPALEKSVTDEPTIPSDAR